MIVVNFFLNDLLPRIHPSPTVGIVAAQSIEFVVSGITANALASLTASALPANWKITRGITKMLVGFSLTAIAAHLLSIDILLGTAIPALANPYLVSYVAGIALSTFIEFSRCLLQRRPSAQITPRLQIVSRPLSAPILRAPPSLPVATAPRELPSFAMHRFNASVSSSPGPWSHYPKDVLESRQTSVTALQSKIKKLEKEIEVLQSNAGGKRKNRKKKAKQDNVIAHQKQPRLDALTTQLIDAQQKLEKAKKMFA